MGDGREFGGSRGRNERMHNSNRPLIRLLEKTELNETDSEVARWLVVSGGAFCVGL